MILGIDLGTTFSVMACLTPDGRPEIIPNREGERVTPSVVFFDGGTPLVGTLARQSAEADPLNAVQFVKRQMGNRRWRFRTAHGDEYSPEAISGIILKRLRDDAERALQCTVTKAVVTVPAYFNDAQRKATIDAGEIAGLSVDKVINEPTAAALAYGFASEQVARAHRVMVYDLGGGTFDVTVMEVDGSQLIVRATGGDKNLGGFDWDNALMLLLNEELTRRGAGGDLDEADFAQELREKAELAKRTLSSREAANVVLRVNGRPVSIQVSRDRFEDVSSPLLSRTIRIAESVLDEGGLRWADIDKVLLVGGSTRMPGVASAIESAFGRAPSAELHPDEVVAQGAALQGALYAIETGALVPVGRAKQLERVSVTDINSHSLGTIALDEGTNLDFNSIILPKGSKLPAEASEIYRTVVDDQSEIRVRITVGEDSDPKYVDVVGEAILTIPPYPKNAPIEVRISYDVNGMVHVRVKDITSGRDLGEVDVPRLANLRPEQLMQIKNTVNAMSIG